MKQLSHVVWSEGMHLAQHHFQAQSRFYQDTVHFAMSGLFYRPYGLLGCELDREALQNDTVSLVHARGVMPDGLAFDVPASDPPPRPLPIRDLFSPTSDSHLVLLAIPAFHPDGANVVQNSALTFDDASVRYTGASAPMIDDMTGRDERAVVVGRKNFRLLLDTPGVVDELVGMVALPIARARRDGAGHFVYDTDYVAPSLHIGASPRLLNLLHRLVEMLEGRADSITRGRRGASDEFAQQEVASFWLLHTIHASLPTLRHMLQARRVHPERLYVELARLAGALCTFSLDAHPRSLPAYDHDAPEACFDALERHIRANLEIVAPSSHNAIRLVQRQPFLHVAPVTDPRSFVNQRWILGVRSPIGVAELARSVPQLAKVCSQKFVLELVRRAFPGLTLDPLPYPPAAIAPRTDTAYFTVTRSGPCWDTIVSTQEVGVYVPEAIPDVELELSIIPE